jgi:hypothetical protein
MTNAQEITRVPSIPQMGLVTRKLIDLLSTTDKKTLTDEELSAAAGRNIRDNGRGGGAGSMSTALRYLEKNHQRVWERVRGAGAIRLNDDKDTAACADSGLSSIRRKARRTVTRLTTIHLDRLDPKLKSTVLAHSAQLGFIATAGSSATTKRLEARSVTPQTDMGKLLEAMAR